MKRRSRPPANWPANLRHLMETTGESVAKLASLAGTDVATVERWLRGDDFPKGQSLFVLSSHYHVAGLDLLHGTVAFHPAAKTPDFRALRLAARELAEDYAAIDLALNHLRDVLTYKVSREVEDALHKIGSAVIGLKHGVKAVTDAAAVTEPLEDTKRRVEARRALWAAQQEYQRACNESAA